MLKYELGDIVSLKTPSLRENKWEIARTGVDIRIKMSRL